MKLEEALRLVAGIVILLSVILILFDSAWWLILTAFVGLNLLQSAFTKWCPVTEVLKKLGLKP